MLRRRHAGRRAVAADRTPEALSPAWEQWVAENLLAGASVETVAAGLVDAGVAAGTAQEAVARVAASPILRAGRRFARHTRRLQLVNRLDGALAAAVGRPTIARRAGLSPAELFAQHYATCTPVVLTDLVPRWPAWGKWTPAYFRARFGEVEIEAVVGRDGDPDYDMHTARLARRMPLRAYLDHIEACGESNDAYFVANSRNIERPGLLPLWDDVAVDPALLDMARRAGGAALWIGPAGTVTPLHHDTSNILFCNLYGTKRFVLASPTEESLLWTQRGVYNRVDPEALDPSLAPGLDRVQWHTVDLAAGEALFLPVGWWHHVRALSVSINLAMTNFAVGNAFDWYRPGEVR